PPLSWSPWVLVSNARPTRPAGQRSPAARRSGAPCHVARPKSSGVMVSRNSRNFSTSSSCSSGIATPASSRISSLAKIDAPVRSASAIESDGRALTSFPLEKMRSAKKMPSRSAVILTVFSCTPSASSTSRNRSWVSGRARVAETGVGERRLDQGGVQLEGDGGDLTGGLAGPVPRPWAALAQYRGHHLLDQRGLAFHRRAQHPQVPGLDAVTAERHDGAGGRQRI